MSRSLNDIIKRSGFGEKMGIKLKQPRKSRANVYKNNIEYKTLSVSMENFSLKATINEVIDFRKVPRSESVGKFIDDAVSNIDKFIQMIISWIEKGIQFVQRAWDRFIGNDIEENLENLVNVENSFKVSGVLTDEGVYNDVINSINDVMVSVRDVETELMEIISPGGVQSRIPKHKTDKLIINAIKYIKKNGGPGEGSSNIAKKLNGGLVLKLRELHSKVKAKGTVDVQKDLELKKNAVNRGKHLYNILKQAYDIMGKIKRNYIDIASSYIKEIKDLAKTTNKKLVVENKTTLIDFTRLLTNEIVRGWNMAIKEFAELISTISVKQNKGGNNNE